MKTLLFYFFCQFSLADKHSLKFFFTGSSGLLNFSELEVFVTVDDNSIAFCDGSNRIMKLNYEWVKKILLDDPELSGWFHQQCFDYQLNFFQGFIASLKEGFKQPEGIHILQLFYSCDWDEDTQNVTAVLKYGYNGEDFITLDLETLTWIALRPEANQTKLMFDSQQGRVTFNKKILTEMCPKWLKISLNKGKSILLRTENPSLSLLQKTPSSPVSCHATGFYPNRVLMFWRKDGEEIHEGVEHREILPNNDGTFQIKIYLNISSITVEDWKKYDCVFQLFDKEEVILKLDEAIIISNREKHRNITTPIIAAVVAFILVSIAAAGYVAYKNKTDGHNPVPSPSLEKNIELTEKLNPDQQAVE